MLEKTESKEVSVLKGQGPFFLWESGLMGSLVRVVSRDHWRIEEQKDQRVILGQ